MVSPSGAFFALFASLIFPSSFSIILLQQGLQGIHAWEGLGSCISSTVTLLRCLGFLFRKQYRKVLGCALIIQKNYRAVLARRRFLQLKQAAVVLQKQLRGQLARRVYRRLLAERREEEEKRRRQEEEER